MLLEIFYIIHFEHRSRNAVLSELGRFPLYFNIIKCMLLYWYRLENLGKEFPLLKEAYNETKLLYLSKKLTWYALFLNFPSVFLRRRLISVFVVLSMFTMILIDSYHVSFLERYNSLVSLYLFYHKMEKNKLTNYLTVS
jgi:hypothetical protein